MRALPGIEAAALADYLPLTLTESTTVVYVEGRLRLSLVECPRRFIRASARITFARWELLLAGREFTPQERDSASRVVIVNEAFARRFWPGENVIGRQFKFGGAAETRVANRWGRPGR
ncbi:MAG: hypothetical protein U0Y68_26510 [Blastocatellia bacterium]